MFVDCDRGPQPSALWYVTQSHPGDLCGRTTDEFLAHETNGAACCWREPDDRIAQCRLAHAVASDQRQDTVLEPQIDALQGVAPSVEDVEFL